MRTFKSVVFICSLCFLGGCSVTATDKTAVESQGPLAGMVELRRQADTAYKQGDFATALKTYSLLSESIKNDPELHFRIGNVYSKLHQPQNAIAAYEKALLLDPRMSKAWHNMGVMQLRQSANTWVQMVSEISPDDPLLPKAVHFSKAILDVLNSEYK